MLGPGLGRRSRHDVVASVQNEMQGPLLGLESLLDALDDGAPHELTAQMRSHIRVLGRRIALLADDLALVSHLDPHAPRLVHEDVDLEAVLDECATLFPDLPVHLESAPGLVVRVDVRRLRQILSNLMRNAQRRGSRPLHLYASDEGRTVRLRVRDPGPRHGHEMFIVDLLVRAHGGRTSHDAVSQSFVVSFPRAPSDAGPRPDLVPTA
jgi:signal transduction histidine kinase